LKKVLYKDLADLSSNYMNFALPIINESPEFIKGFKIDHIALSLPVFETMINLKGQHLLYKRDHPFFHDYYFDVAKNIKKTIKRFKRERFWNL
jgi:hypothetical protein